MKHHLTGERPQSTWLIPKELPLLDLVAREALELRWMLEPLPLVNPGGRRSIIAKRTSTFLEARIPFLTTPMLPESSRRAVCIIGA